MATVEHARRGRGRPRRGQAGLVCGLAGLRPGERRGETSSAPRPRVIERPGWMALPGTVNLGGSSGDLPRSRQVRTRNQPRAAKGPDPTTGEAAIGRDSGRPGCGRPPALRSRQRTGPLAPRQESRRPRPWPKRAATPRLSWWAKEDAACRSVQLAPSDEKEEERSGEEHHGNAIVPPSRLPQARYQCLGVVEPFYRAATNRVAVGRKPGQDATHDKERRHLLSLPPS